MNILCIADTHGDPLDLTDIEKCDYIFLLGDMGGSYAWQIKDALREQPRLGSRIYSILGNHDDPADIWNYPWLNYQKYGQRQDISDGRYQYSVLFLPFREKYGPVPLITVPDVIVSHQPPVTYQGMSDFHKGVPELREIRRRAPGALWIHGHIHVNASAMNGNIQSVYGSDIIRF